VEEETKPKNKKITPYIVIIIVVIVILLGGVTYAGLMIKNRLQNAVGGFKVDTTNNTYNVKTGNLNTVVGQDNIPWPAELPIDVPKYQGGKIKAVTHDSGQNIWVISVSDTSRAEFNNYKTYLINTGWKENEQTNVPVDIVQMKKAENQITVTFEPTSKTLLISLSPVK